MPSAKPNPITVLCVDDSVDLVDLMALAINREPDMECVGCLSDAAELLQHVETLKPAVVLIDLTMPKVDPLEVVRAIRVKCPDTKPVVYSGYDDNATIRAALDAGAFAFVSKHNDLSKIFATIRDVVRCGSPAPI